MLLNIKVNKSAIKISRLKDQTLEDEEWLSKDLFCITALASATVFLCSASIRPISINWETVPSIKRGVHPKFFGNFDIELVCGPSGPTCGPTFPGVLRSQTPGAGVVPRPNMVAGNDRN